MGVLLIRGFDCEDAGASLSQEILHYLNVPVVYVLNTAVLDALKVIVHLLASLANLHAVVVSNVVVEVVQCADRRDNCSSTASTSLLKCSKLLNRNVALLNS